MQRFIRLLLDLLLLLLMPVVVCVMLTGLRNHEWLGALLGAGMVLHLILNRRWFRHPIGGKISVARLLAVAVNFLLLGDILTLIVTGLFISRFLFAWTGLPSLHLFGASAIHFCAGYWALLLVGLHLGQHTPVIFGMLRVRKWPKSLRFGLRLLFLAIAAYGIYFFVNEGVSDFLVPEESFIITDTPPALYLAGLASLLTTAALVGFHLNKAATR